MAQSEQDELNFGKVNVSTKSSCWEDIAIC